MGKVNVGVAYAWGLGVRKDPALAAQLFREAAKKGEGLGASYLGLLYYFGIGVQKDPSEAMHWLEVGTRLHSVSAKYNLALMLLQRTDRASHDRAIDLLRESVSAGHVAAMHQLGLELTNQPSYARSSNENIELLETAASSGYWKSSIVLGVLARDGHGVPKDEKEAYYHFRVAALQGGDPAFVMVQNDIARLRIALGQEQIAKLDLQAADWVNKHNEHLELINLRGNERSYPAFALKYPEKDVHAGTLISAPQGESIQSVGDFN
jgi:TPR repeat protein